MSNKIRFILAFPRSQRYYGYYINNNFKDKHLMERDKFYLFVAGILKSPAPAKVREYIDRNRYFLVDTENNEVSELDYRNEKDFENLKKLKTVTLKDAEKEFRRRKKEEKKEQNRLYDKNISKLHKDLGIP